MPFVGLHSFRIHSPGKYDDFRTVTNAFKPGIDVVYGITGTRDARKSEVQAIRFHTNKFTKAQAVAWLKAHDYTWIRYEAPKTQAAKISPPQILDVAPSKWAAVDLDPRPDGQKPRRFRKELVREGEWTHPVTRDRLTFTKKDLVRWERMFGKMTALDMKIPILQDHMPMVSGGCGWVTSMEVEQIHDGARRIWALFGTLEFGEEWAAKILEGDVRDVSVGIADVRDSHKRLFAEVIEEVSVTLWPVIREQTGFERLGRAVGFSYNGPRRRSGWGRQSKEGDRMRRKRKRPRQEIPEIDLATMEGRMDDLEEENEKLKVDLAARDVTIEAGKTELATLHGAKIEAAKATVLSAIKVKIETDKTLSPHAGEQLSKMVEEDFSEGVTVEKAEARRDHFIGTLSALTEKVIPDKKTILGASKTGNDETAMGQDLDGFVDRVLGQVKTA